MSKALCSKRLMDEIEKALSTPDNLSAKRFVEHIRKSKALQEVKFINSKSKHL